MIEKKKSDDNHVCTHMAFYKQKKTAEYIKLAKEFEIEDHCSGDGVSDCRKCMTVIMSQLCDKVCVTLISSHKAMTLC